MTNTQAAERQAKHECLVRELVEALKWNAGALQMVVNESGSTCECDVVTRGDTGTEMTIGCVLDLADAILARAKEQQQ